MTLHSGQSDPKKGWLFMSLYWATGYLVGLYQGYIKRFEWNSFTVWHLLAVIVTLEGQRRFNIRIDRYGRQPDIPFTLLFTLANAVFETFCFLGSYDLGRHYLQRKLGLSKVMGIAAGWSIYYCYSAMIHVLFWLPIAFPKHIKVHAPPFHKHGLPILSVISIAWFGIYENYEDIFFVCLLHSIVDGWGGWNIALRGPFADRRRRNC